MPSSRATRVDHPEPLAALLGDQLLRHPHRPLAQLSRIPPLRRMLIPCSILTSKVRSLRGSQADSIQRLEKVLQDAGIKLSSVASGTWSKSSRSMVEALIAGERDTTVLADLSQSRMRAKKDQLEMALDGHFAEHHGAVARRVIDHIDFLDASIESLNRGVVDRLRAFEPAIGMLCEIPGWGRTTAEIFIAETGGDMSVFPTPEQLASWAGVAPGTHESAGKRHAAASMNGNRWLGRALIEAARAAARTKGTFLSARYRRLVARRGPNKAAVAIAHTIVVIAWHILTTGEPYRELGDDYYTRREDPERQARRLTRQLKTLGFNVAITPAA